MKFTIIRSKPAHFLDVCSRPDLTGLYSYLNHTYTYLHEQLKLRCKTDLQRMRNRHPCIYDSMHPLYLRSNPPGPHTQFDVAGSLPSGSTHYAARPLPLAFLVSGAWLGYGPCSAARNAA